MIQTDEASFICDMAETYHIFDYKAIPFDLLVTLANGLRETSRIRCKMADIPIEMTTFFLVGIYDELKWIAWTKSEDAQHGRNCPDRILPKLLGVEEEKEIMSFATPEEFERAWHRGEE